MNGYVVTPALEGLIRRAGCYLEAGLPVHLRGPAGAGKSSLAAYLAAQRGRPVYLLRGNEAFAGFDLAGQAGGFRQRSVVDRYVHSVVKRTLEVENTWAYGPLVQAVREGGTLIYDEFTRSRPEANTVLLSALEEGVLELPDSRRGLRQVEVHPEFRAILTSNPAEYAGVHSSADALRDRMVTLDLGARDLETDAAIVAARCSISPEAAMTVVMAMAERLGGGARCSLRPALMAGRVVAAGAVPAESGDPAFEQLCDDLTGRGVEPS
ncbi:MAG TPA: gas vesicle protein GvpN [Symbiobacteriaceae bacterium]|nr:gas vesicle protein GvpN [Symbiobacteriaceae bacterium]